MIFGQDRDQLRGMYCKAWQQHRRGQPLDALQAQIVAVVEQHPEYHALLENPDKALARDYTPELGETNPFLHMGMHLAIAEQVSIDRPPGIRTLYNALLRSSPDGHALEHRMMDCLAEAIWQAQRNGQMPDEQRYLDCIRAMIEEG